MIDSGASPNVPALAGLRVAVTRSADRAGAMADALAAAGAQPVLVPLIDFEVGDPVVLGEALRRLTAGEYRWLVISSITTVRALKQWCEVNGTSLPELIPASTSVATIGPTSVAVLAAEGIHAVLAPEDIQSAAGLVALWPQATATTESNNQVLLPQSNLAEATLKDGLSAKGWAPETVTAYRTVDYPARDDRRLTAPLAPRTQERYLPEGASGSGASSGPGSSGSPGTIVDYPQLTPTQAAQDMQTGVINAVVLASGSAARRVSEALAPIPARCLVVAIGQPTRAEAERLGMEVAATAAHPTPEGIVAALAQALARQDPH